MTGDRAILIGDSVWSDENWLKTFSGKATEEIDRKRAEMDEAEVRCCVPLPTSLIPLPPQTDIDRPIAPSAAAAPTELPLVFFDIAIRNQSVGRVTVQLRRDVVPRTCENFISLCTFAKGFGFKGSKFHRIIPDFVSCFRYRLSRCYYL